MNVLDAIYTRRSIRSFTGKVISDEELLSLLNAGFAAPSANNHQPWEFIVVKDQDKINEIVNIHPYSNYLPTAGCGIIVCGNKDSNSNLGLLVQDCSAAVENILLAAHGIKLGAVWCSIYPNEKISNGIVSIFNLPEHVIPIALVVVGDKAEDKEPEHRYDERKVHYNQW
ncbi:MAG: nitroreductase [Haloplasmataceae bacterium]|jgi:nitroreductase|nr:nitroreductase [Haloplasmataceae bacterium]